MRSKNYNSNKAELTFDGRCPGSWVVLPFPDFPKKYGVERYDGQGDINYLMKHIKEHRVFFVSVYLIRLLPQNGSKRESFMSINHIFANAT